MSRDAAYVWNNFLWTFFGCVAFVAICIAFAWGSTEGERLDQTTKQAAVQACAAAKSAQCTEIVMQGYPTTQQSQSIQQSTTIQHP